MEDAVLALVASPVIYLVVVGICAADAVVPAFPSETTVIALGVLAADGQISLGGLVVAAALGAVLGDHTGYWLGRRAGPAVRERYLSGRRGRRLYDQISQMLADRGGSAVVIGRYVPGGRTTVALLAGSTRFPLRRFTAFDVFAGITWALYAALLGYWGGKTFEDTWDAILVSAGIGVLILVLSETARVLLRRRKQRARQAP